MHDFKKKKRVWQSLTCVNMTSCMCDHEWIGSWYHAWSSPRAVSYIVWSWLDWFMISCMVKPQYIVWSWLEWFMISCLVKPQGYIIYKVIMTGLIHDIMHGQASRVVSHIMIMTGLVHDWIGSWYHAWSSLKAVWHFMIMTGLVHDIMHGQASRLFDILCSGLDWIMMPSMSNISYVKPPWLRYHYHILHCMFTWSMACSQAFRAVSWCCKKMNSIVDLAILAYIMDLSFWAAITL